MEGCDLGAAVEDEGPISSGDGDKRREPDGSSRPGCSGLSCQLVAVASSSSGTSSKSDGGFVDEALGSGVVWAYS